MQSQHDAALRVCREKYEAFAAEQRRREGDAYRPPDGGPLFSALLWWDVLTFASRSLATALLLGTSSYPFDHWFVWYALEITKCAQALCGFPFLLIGLLPLLSFVGYSGLRVQCPNLVTSVGTGALPPSPPAADQLDHRWAPIASRAAFLSILFVLLATQLTVEL